MTDLGGGEWRYEYAVFNWNLDGMVDSFSVPSGGVASDFYFHDIDDIAANDWGVTVAGGMVTWSFGGSAGDGTPPSKLAEEIEFGELYNFGFTSNSAPTPGTFEAGVAQPGPGGDLVTGTISAPAAGDPPWTDLANGKAGTGGQVPVLAGVGPLTAGSANSLETSNALANATATLVVGATNLSAAFKGGVMVPTPDFLIAQLIDGTGSSSLPFTWPNGIPAGTEFFLQMWVDDVGGTNDLAASNGLKGEAQ